MIKKLLPILMSILLISTFALSGCKQQVHAHEWKEATCSTPKTCKTCGETEGVALGHKWKDYTCTVCGTVDTTKKDKAKGNEAVKLLSYTNDACDVMSIAISKAWHFSIYEYKNYYTRSNDATLTDFAKYIGLKKDIVKKGVDSYFKKHGYDTKNYVVCLGVSNIAVNCVEEIFTQSGLIDSMKKSLSEAAAYIGEITDSNNNGKQEVWNYYVSVKTYTEFCFYPSGSYANLSSNLSSYRNECNKASVSCERYFG